MSLPLCIQKMGSSASVPQFVFDKASTFFSLEEYTKAKDILDGYLETPVRIMSSTEVGGDKLLGLYTNTLFYLKEYDLLNSLLPNWSVLAAFPATQLVRIRLLDVNGQHNEAQAQCNLFIEGNKSSLSEFLPDYLNYRGYTRSRIGNLEGAMEDFETSYALFRFQKRSFEMGLAAARKGILHLQLAEYFESIQWGKKALFSFIEQNLLRKQSMVQINLGIAYYKTGNLKASQKSLAESHKIATEGNWPHRQLYTNIALANVFRMHRQFSDARQHLHTAYTQAQALGYPREEALALEFLGDVFRDEDRPNEAKRYYNRALAIATTIAPKGDIVMEIHRRNGECHLANGELGQAVSELKKSLSLSRTQGDRFEEAAALRIMSQVKRQASDLTAAESLISESVEILTDIGARYELALSFWEWMELKHSQISQGDSGIPSQLLLLQAWDHASKALEHFNYSGAKFFSDKCRNEIERIGKLRMQEERSSNKNAAKSKNKISGTNSIMYASTAMAELLKMVDYFASTEAPVLIFGETGTGKELIARRLHQMSSRNQGKLVSVNMTAIPETMFERELFGHTQGSFSGADQSGDGFVAEASGGTLFLDEIGELPLSMQPKLLRLLQEGTYQALGDPTERISDLRIVAATNANLASLVSAGKFRADLFYRLKTLELDLPPLRDRDGDVLFLLRHFLCQFAGKSINLSDYFTQLSLDNLVQYNWPGNIRKLQSLAQRASVELLGNGRVNIKVAQEGNSSFFAQGPEKAFGQELAMEAACGGTETASSHLIDRSRLVSTLKECKGNKVKAARILKISRSSLYRNLSKFGLD